MTAPILGEPLPIELANTIHAARGHSIDELETPEQLLLWLDDVRARLPLPLPDQLTVDPWDLPTARDLRDTIRTLATAVVNGRTPPPDAVESLNRHIRAAPSWRELEWNEAPTPRPNASAPPIAAVLSAIAQQTADLLTGPHLHDLRACGGPGCVLFFVKDHPRRTWCSAGCGNRARVARHHAKHH